MLSDEELLALSREAFSDKQFVALTYDSGAYEITNPTVELQKFARAVERAVIERCEAAIRTAAKCDCGHPCDCFDLAAAVGAIRAMLEDKP